MNKKIEIGDYIDGLSNDGWKYYHKEGTVTEIKKDDEGKTYYILDNKIYHHVYTD